MPDFRYIARELSGKQTEGTLTAANEREALGQLTARSLFPMKITMAQASLAHRDNKRRRVPARILCVFYTQLSDLLRAGVPLLRSLDLLIRQTRHVTLKGSLCKRCAIRWPTARVWPKRIASAPHCLPRT